jgi:hypothetical protein
MYRRSRRKYVRSLLLVLGVAAGFLAMPPRLSAAVDLLYFRARSGFSAITLEWETASELDNLGFNLYRSETGDFLDAETLNGALIASKAAGQPTGAYYEWADVTAQLDVIYTYWLEDVDFDGSRDIHDPIQASLSGGVEIPTQPPPAQGTPTATRTSTPTPAATTATSVTSLSTSAPSPAATGTPADSSSDGQFESTPVIAAPPTSTAFTIQTVPTRTASPVAVGSEALETSDTFEQGPTEQPTKAANEVEVSITPLALTADTKPAEMDDETRSYADAVPVGQGVEQLAGKNAVEDDLSAQGNPNTFPVLIVVAVVMVMVLAAGGGIAFWIFRRQRRSS